MMVDIASVVFICVTANHLGLISAIEKVIGFEIPIINCPKCLTFWMMMVYGLFANETNFVNTLAVSFLSSYLALWLELLEGYIDTLYMKIYEKIYPNPDNDTVATDTDNGNPSSTVSEL